MEFLGVSFVALIVGFTLGLFVIGIAKEAEEQDAPTIQPNSNFTINNWRDKQTS